MPPFLLPIFSSIRLTAWGWGLPPLGMAPGRWPVCVGSVGSVGSVGGVLQSLGCSRWIASAADKGGFLLIHHRLILIVFLGVLYQGV